MLWVILLCLWSIIFIVALGTPLTEVRDLEYPLVSVMIIRNVISSLFSSFISLIAFPKPAAELLFFCLSALSFPWRHFEEGDDRWNIELLAHLRFGLWTVLLVDCDILACDFYYFSQVDLSEIKAW